MERVLIEVNRRIGGNDWKENIGGRGNMCLWRYTVLWHGCTSLWGLLDSRQKHKVRRFYQYSEQC